MHVLKTCKIHIQTFTHKNDQDRCTHTHTFTHRHTYTLTYLYTQRQADKHKHTHIHTHTHTHTHMHTWCDIFAQQDGCANILISRIWNKTRKRSNLIYQPFLHLKSMHTQISQWAATDTQAPSTYGPSQTQRDHLLHPTLSFFLNFIYF